MSVFNRRGRAVSHQPSKAFMYAVGLFGIAFASLLIWIGYHAPQNIPGRGYYNLYAQFNDADNLTQTNQVRIAGRLVGQVLDLHAHNGEGEMRLQLTPGVKPLLSDTTLVVRPRSPVGVHYIDLIPGTKGTPLPNNAVIPATQTTASRELDEALGTLNAPARVHAQMLLNALGEGFAGRGDDINLTLTNSPSALNNLGQVTGAIAARTGAAGRFIQYSNGAAAAADPVRQTIATGFHPEAQALQPFYVAGNGLSSTLQKAPNDLSSTRDSLSQTDPFLSALSSLSHDALPVLDAAPSSFTRAAALLRDARPAMRELGGTFKLLDDATNPTLSLLDTINPALPDIDTGLTSSLPILSNLAPRGCDIHNMLGNWESMLEYGDSTGNYLRFMVYGVTPQSVGGYGAKLPGINIQDDAYPAPCVATEGGGKG
ncbi:MAG TPA: MlaD family protein [Solirubrobacteraceae bacterium]|jgi:virulence factor Mce-like protein|nr:MlaD family protein [Solirubrobacteraceae bacterium]